ncbi:MAG TPA: DUF1499 domain-containing protein [Burkholderiales bacterium]|nr:DUF1499 domain-containing protein [Burkholderiales bacterium]
MPLLRRNPTRLSGPGSRLEPCPDSPNCVCSDAPDKAHAIAPFRLAVPAAQAWEAACAAVASMPRTRIVTESAEYLHAECTSAVFRFIDDLELQLRAGEGIIAVRSASRLGYSDFGVNRHRVKQLHAVLAARGVIC